MPRTNFYDDNRQSRAERHKPTEEEIARAKAARAKYAREYRAKNPEKNKEACRRYWIKRAARESQGNEDGK